MTIPDEAVEAAARAMYPQAWNESVMPFIAFGETPDVARERVQRMALESARTGLEAAILPLAEHMRDERRFWCLDDSGRFWIARTLHELEELATGPKPFNNPNKAPNTSPPQQ